MSKPLYNRILLKLSGEALQGSYPYGFDSAILLRLAKDVSEVRDLNIQVAIVIGGGNIFRGKTLSDAGLGRVTGDHMGMLATVMNGLALRDAFEQLDIPTRLMSAIPMTGVVDPYNRRKAITHLKQDRVVIFTAGTGNPFFTTDSAACLRAIEVDADVVLKGTKVDGIYSADPVIHQDAKRYATLSYEDVLQQDLGVMDLTAICLARDYNLPIRVFNMNTPHNLKKVMLDPKEGSTVSNKVCPNDTKSV